MYSPDNLLLVLQCAQTRLMSLQNDTTVLGAKCAQLAEFLENPNTVEQSEDDYDLALLQAQLDAMRVLLFFYELRLSKMQ